MSGLYKTPRHCECGFSTLNRGTWSTHSRTCKQSDRVIDPTETIQLRERVASLEKQNKQMEDQNKQMADQLAAKDKQIDQLIKRPRTVNHNRFMVHNNVNCFGKETLDHISYCKYQELL